MRAARDCRKSTKFLADIKKVYEKHGLALSFEDFDGDFFQGDFVVELLDDHHIDWLAEAYVDPDVIVKLNKEGDV